MSEKKDIRKVMEEEKRRGIRRRPLDTASAEQQARTRAKFLRAIIDYNEEDFIRAIGELGHLPGSPEYERMMGLWREHVRALRR